ncbi:hypothetical protein N9948_01610 [bacterium]|nr:hypothetical protein [bacterium]
MEEYVVYEFCKNELSVITMTKKRYSFGQSLELTCGYTNEELHYIILGELG